MVFRQLKIYGCVVTLLIDYIKMHSMLWQLQISMYLFFFVFQLVFWCFNTHPKTSMTWFLVLFWFFFVCFCFLVWLYSLQWHILCIRTRYQKPLLTLTVLLNKQAPKASPCLFVWPYVKWFYFIFFFFPPHEKQLILSLIQTPKAFNTSWHAGYNLALLWRLLPSVCWMLALQLGSWEQSDAFLLEQQEF